VATNHWTELFAFGDPTNTATVFALSAATGAIQWQVEVAQPVFGALTLAADVLYHGDTAGRVYARDAATGAELWSTEPGGDIGGGMSIVDGTLLVGHGFWFFTQLGEPNGGLVAYGLD
jgi:outer membrane protein assembly factor BamB